MMIKRGNISEDGKTFSMYAVGSFHKDIQKDLIKNKKVVLEIIATELLFPKDTKPRKFRDTKPKLVEKILALLQFEDIDENSDDWELVCTKNEFTVPAGDYYVGDLCYDMKDTVYHEIWGEKFGFESGLYRRKSDGAVFGMFRTEGGRYKDRVSDKEYYDDAGNFGIASSVLCYGEQEHVNFSHEGWCSGGYGMYNFGHIEIREFHDEDSEDDY